MPEPKPPWKYLARKPGSRYEQLCVAGSKIQARQIYAMHMEENLSEEQIARDFPRLPLEAIREAIAYVKGNPPELERDFALEEEFFARLDAKNRPDTRTFRNFLSR